MSTVKEALNSADPNVLADILRQLGFGNVLRSMPIPIRKSDTAASTYVGAASRVCVDQDVEAPALSILSAYARSGAGAVGALTAVAFPPGAGQVAIAPNGKVVTAAADVWTSVDVSYVPEKGEVVEFTGNVVPGTGVMALPAGITSRGVIRLLEAEALVGTSTGLKFCDAIGAAVAAGEAALPVALTTVLFAVADAVSSARVKLLVCSEVDVNTKLPDTNESFI